MTAIPARRRVFSSGLKVFRSMRALSATQQGGLSSQHRPKTEASGSSGSGGCGRVSGDGVAMGTPHRYLMYQPRMEGLSTMLKIDPWPSGAFASMGRSTWPTSGACRRDQGRGRRGLAPLRTCTQRHAGGSRGTQAPPRRDVGERRGSPADGLVPRTPREARRHGRHTRTRRVRHGARGTVRSYLHGPAQYGLTPQGRR